MKFQSAIVASYLFVTASAEECFLPLDVMFLQDTTGSFDDDLPNVVEQVPLIMASITGRFPGSMFGVAEFRDKPYYPLGESDDFCYKIGEEGRLTRNVNDFTYAYSLLYASGGADLPESQFQALINLVFDLQVGWRPIFRPNSPTTFLDHTGARVIILSTDAVPHLNGDMARYADFPLVPQGLPANSGHISTDDINFECLHQEYPSPQQMQAAMQSTNTTLIILTPNMPEIVPVWTYVNTVLLGQDPKFYQFIEHDSSDMFEAILRALEGSRVTAECPTTTSSPGISQSSASTEAGLSLATDVPTQSETMDLTDQCPCPGPDPCEECCQDAVFIKLAERPKKLQLIVDNEGTN